MFWDHPRAGVRYAGAKLRDAARSCVAEVRPGQFWGLPRAFSATSTTIKSSAAFDAATIPTFVDARPIEWGGKKVTPLPLLPLPTSRSQADTNLNLLIRHKTRSYQRLKLAVPGSRHAFACGHFPFATTRSHSRLKQCAVPNHLALFSGKINHSTAGKFPRRIN